MEALTLNENKIYNYTSAKKLLYSRKNWWNKALANLAILDYLEEKSLVNGLIMANGY